MGSISATFTTFNLAPRQQDCLNQLFEVNGKVYRGTLLFAYPYNTPTRGNLKTAVLNQSQMEAWAPEAEAAFVETLTTVETFWHRCDMVAIHGKGPPAPDVLHAPERTVTQSTLRPCFGAKMLTAPVWRAHMTERAVASLSTAEDIRNHIQTRGSVWRKQGSHQVGKQVQGLCS